MHPTGVNINATGSTLASLEASSSAGQAPKLFPAPAIASGNDDHNLHSRRWFLGPMPQNIVKKEVDKYRIDWIKQKTSHGRGLSLKPPSREGHESGNSSEEETDGSIDHEHVYNYFIRNGGNEDDWDVDVERSLRKEIRRRVSHLAFCGAAEPLLHFRSGRPADGTMHGTENVTRPPTIENGLALAF